MFERVVALVGALLMIAAAACGTPPEEVDPPTGSGQAPRTDPQAAPSGPLPTAAAVQTLSSGADAQFRAVSAGWAHSCGIRVGGTVTCWGDNSSGQSETPTGRFRAVAAGSASTCGLHSDGTITCWGNNALGQAEAPGGWFETVIAGGGHMCGLRTDDTITCWGWNVSGQTEAPSGQFSAVTAGWAHSCGLRTDDTITCWGLDNVIRAGPKRPDGCASAPSARASGTPAGCAPTAPSPAGDSTSARAWRLDSAPSPPAGNTPAGCSNRWHHHLLGEQRLPEGRCARRALQRRHRRWPAQLRAGRRRQRHLLGPTFRHAGGGPVRCRQRRLGTRLRAGNRRHNHLLGPRRPWAGQRARRPIQRRQRRLAPLLRTARRRHHHLLGRCDRARLERRRLGLSARQRVASGRPAGVVQW